MFRYELALAAGADVELAAAMLWAAGSRGVWDRDGQLVAWFDRVVDAVPPGGTWSPEPDVDWQQRWRDSIQPVTAGRVTVVPSWLDVDADARPGDGGIRIVLDPGRAFGTGHHATTALCLERLQALQVRGRSVLDVGTGSGILAIAAARLGARPVTAVDVDVDAVAVARANVARSGVAVDVRAGTVDGRDRADVVVANLLTGTLVDLAAALVAAVEPGGHLVVSGVASDRIERVAGALGSAGLTVTGDATRDGWAALWGDA